MYSNADRNFMDRVKSCSGLGCGSISAGGAGELGGGGRGGNGCTECWDREVEELTEKDMKPEESTMTCLDMLKMDRPDIFENGSFEPIIFCPYDRGYLKGDKPPHCPRNRSFGPFFAFDLFSGVKDPCAICWNMPAKENKTLRGSFVSDGKKDRV